MALTGLPAVAFAGATTVSVTAAAGATAIVPLVPLIEPMPVSVAVTVRLPVWVKVTPFVNVWAPLSAPTKV